MRSVPKEDDESHRWSSSSAKSGKLSVSPFDNVKTIYDLSKRAFEEFADKPCMGTRTYLGMKSVKPPVKEFEPKVNYSTFAEVGEQAAAFGSALVHNGLVAAPTTTTLKELKTPCSLAIFENTCAEWQIAAQGCFTQSIIVTTIYATLGMEAVIDSVKDCNIKAILCNKTSVDKLVKDIKRMPSLSLIIYTNDMIGPNDEVSLPKSPKGVKIVSFEDFIAEGQDEPLKPKPPKADTCAVIMFTSGSTGKPKGVVVTHGNLLATVAGAIESLGVQLGTDVYLGYLPLAHILELMAEFSMIGFGCCICYADPKVLTATGSYPVGALEAYSPTIMAGVPKIWDVIKKGVQAKVAAGSPVAKLLVDTAFAWRSFAISHGFDTPLFKALVFKKFATVVGGKLRLAISGGGPLNTEVQLFVRTAFGCPLFQGYGLTETCAGLSMQDPADLRCGIAGVPLASCEVKLESCPDVKDKAGLGYLTTDRRDVAGNAVFGRGEVLVRGNNISKGYYMMPDQTAEAWEKDGWFHSGDIGQFMDDGSIRIVDRKKNLVKLKGGEYIAIENMEMSYGNSVFCDAVAGGICCYGDGDMDRPVALMQLNAVTVKAWAKKNGVAGEFDELKNDKAVYHAVLADLQNEGKKAGLSNLEKIVAVAFLTSPWTPDNGCLTAANKLQRREVINQFEKEFEAVKVKGIF
jgi:long-chain acyl-CoA synthetase